MRRAILLFVAAALGCGHAGASDTGDGGDAADLAAGAPDDGGALGPATYLLSLDAGAFAPGPHPSALVYVPRGFDATPPVQVVVFLHGFHNCVENVVRDSDGECEPDGGTRAAYALETQLEATAKNALLVVPELAFDQATGNPGNLGTTDGFRALVAEALADLPLGLSAADVGTIVVASHSGGYQAAAAIATNGGLPIAELYLLDSLYGNFSDFDAWAQAVAPGKRFADVYTQGGGTLANSQAMADRAASQGWVPAAQLLDDRTTDTLTDAQYAQELLFKLSALSHDGVPAYYFGKLVGTSVLANKN